jgi:hypothetical protein
MNAVTKDLIAELQTAVCKLPQAELITNHYFCDGMYAREVLIPAGCVIVGKIHTHEHLAILSKGRMAISQADRPRMIMECGMLIISMPGAKRVGYAFEDSRFVTIHRTDLTDIAEIERQVTEDDPQSMYLPGNIRKHGALT